MSERTPAGVRTEPATPRAGGRTQRPPRAAPGGSARDAARGRARRRARWRAAGVAALVVSALAALIWAVAFSSLLAVRNVQVAGVQRLTADEVHRVAAVPTGGSLALLDTGAIARRIQALPPVAEVSVQRRLPHTVRIAVTERTPTAVVATPGGLQLADAEGVRFAPVLEVPRGLPVIRTDSTDPSPETLSRAADLLAALPAAVRAVVVEVHADTPDDMYVELRGGRTVIWGGPEQSALKARVLDVLFGKRRADTYDVSVPEVPVIRR